MDSGELILSTENNDRICVPEAARNDIIKIYHENSHTGIEITNSRIADKYYWPKMKDAVADFVRSCKYCQLNKPDNNPNKPPVLSFPTPNGPFEAYGFDMIGPLRVTDRGNIYVFTGIDFFSKKAYGLPLNSKKSGYLLEMLPDVLVTRNVIPASVSRKRFLRQSINSMRVRKGRVNMFLNVGLFLHQFLCGVLGLAMKIIRSYRLEDIQKNNSNKLD